MVSWYEVSKCRWSICVAVTVVHGTSKFTEHIKNREYCTPWYRGHAYHLRARVGKVWPDHLTGEALILQETAFYPQMDADT